MPPRRKLPRHKRGRTWRAGPEPGRSVLTKGRRSASRRASRFSPLPPWRPEPELSPLHKIPTLRPWLAARAKMPRDIAEARTAC
jgi:hypothetical protein